MTDVKTDRRITSRHRLKWWLDLLRLYRAGDQENAASQLVFHKRLTSIIATAFGPQPGRLRILEIGCGQRASQTILFTADGCDTIGIDVEVPTFRITLPHFFKIIGINGWERALKSIFRHWLFDGQFFLTIASQYGKPLPLDRVEVRLMSATDLEFPDNYFDFIYSSLVFEHIDDVPAAAREVNRVLKPQGRAWINVHLFPSLSGGHQPEWTNINRDNPADSRIPPYDHLLDNQYPAGNYLNKLRWADYQKIFQEHLAVMSETPLLEPISVLTPEMEESLLAKGYTRKDLMTREVAFLCRKRAA